MTVVLDVLKHGQGCLKTNYENLQRLSCSAMSFSHPCIVRMEGKIIEILMDIFPMISFPPFHQLLFLYLLREGI